MLVMVILIMTMLIRHVGHCELDHDHAVLYVGHVDLDHDHDYQDVGHGDRDGDVDHMVRQLYSQVHEHWLEVAVLLLIFTKTCSRRYFCRRLKLNVFVDEIFLCFDPAELKTVKISSATNICD